MVTMNRDLPNNEKQEKWAKGFLGRLEMLSKTNSKNVELISGGRKKSRYALLTKNLQKIVEFQKFKMSNDSVKPLSMARVASYVIFFSNFIGDKSFDEVKKKDVINYINFMKERGYSEWYMSRLKLSVKTFFKWFYECDDGYPDVVKHIKLKTPKNEVDPRKCIEMEEVQKMLEICSCKRNKVFLLILLETGARLGEIISLRLSDIKFDEYGAILNVSGKTGKRPIRIIKATSELKSWLNDHPRKNDVNAPLLCSFDHSNYGGFITSASGLKIIKRMTKAIGRRMHLHNLNY